MSTQVIPEQINQPTVSNSRSASPLTAQHEASAASDDDNEMESINARSKRGHHDSSDEEPNSPVCKNLPLVPQPVSGLALPCRQGQEISIFCPNPPRPGGQGSSGGERSPIRPPDNQKHKDQIKPSNQSKSRVTKTHINHGSQLHYPVEL